MGSLEVFFLAAPILCSSVRDLLRCPGGCTLDSVVTYPVVGLAGEVPVADAGVQGDGFSVVSELPVGSAKWCDDLVAAAACAVVGDTSEPHGDV